MEEVVFLKVDVDENEDAAQEYSISAMPTFIFVKKEAKVCKNGIEVILYFMYHLGDFFDIKLVFKICFFRLLI